jgi:hypothetical protein
MATTTPSQYMNMPIPIPGVDPGPQYALDLNTCLTITDAHDHDQHNHNGGLPITQDAIVISADLTFNNNGLTQMKRVGFSPVASASGIANDTIFAQTGVSSSASDLVFIDGNGTAIPITKNGVVFASATNLPGLSWSSPKWIFDQTQAGAATTPAQVDLGNIMIHPESAGFRAGTDGILISAPSSITLGSGTTNLILPLPPAASYGLLQMSHAGAITPVVAPSATSFVLQDNSGNTSFLTQAKGITAAMIADNTVTGSQMANGTVGTTQLSTGVNNRLNLTALRVAAVTTGSPSCPGGFITPIYTAPANTYVLFSFDVAHSGSADGTVVYVGIAASASWLTPVATINTVDTIVHAGAHNIWNTNLMPGQTVYVYNTAGNAYGFSFTALELQSS